MHAPRVLMVIQKFFPAVGGAERQCLLLSKNLVQQSCHVLVATTRLQRELSPQECIEGIDVHRVRRWRPAEVGLAAWFCHFVAWRNTYDIIHVHEVNQAAAVAAVWAGRVLSKPVIMKCVNSGQRFDLLRAHREKRWPLHSLIRWAAFRADAVIAISKSIEQELREAGICPSRIRRIPNGVTLRQGQGNDERRACRDELGIPADAVVMLRVGTLSEKKGISYLIDAWPHVKQRCPNAWLVSVGGEAIPEDLAKYANSDNERVRVVPNRVEGVEPFLQAADTFVLPSLAEGLSNALLEAQAAGLPCVVTDVGGNCDVVQHEVNGLVIPPGDATALGAAMVRLATSHAERQRMGAAARREAGHFNIAGVAEKYRGLYTQLIERGARCNG